MFPPPFLFSISPNGRSIHIKNRRSFLRRSDIRLGFGLDVAFIHSHFSHIFHRFVLVPVLFQLSDALIVDFNGSLGSCNPLTGSGMSVG